MFWVNSEVISASGAMTCFPFHKGEKNDEPKATKSTSVRSSTSISMSTDHEVRRSGSEFNSQMHQTSALIPLRRPHLLVCNKDPAISKYSPSLS
ncbi:hypothetical protein CK203_104678 [Vitis vinifera]|uniref:Uncharacterized protein n=1 Tax=Vitis vinifera TaxID=29760 RepID=A0A438CWI2_VITVI|nr:hypothetical protein CK203_104678 [Vitis vinifera]